MPETRVPMTLRDQFLQDPFFKSAWDDMEKFRSSFFQNSSSSSSAKSVENTAATNTNAEKSLATVDDDGFGGWLLPRKWMLPSLLDEDSMMQNMKMSDSGVINYVDTAAKTEISLNTAGYKPSELSINVTGGQLRVEGRHEERSEAGHSVVTRCFRRQYGLHPDTKMEDVVSNLSQDGVLVITLPKEKRIQEVKEDRKIAVENKKSSAATAESNTAQKINVERKSSTGSVNMNRKSSVEKSSSSESALASEKKSSKDMSSGSIVPMNLRDSFFDDPFFQDNWMDIQQSQKNFFSKAQEQFKQQMQKMESSMNERMSLSNFFDKDFSLAKFDKDFELPKLQKLHLHDEHELSVVTDKDKLEIRLDTAGYKPDELRVTAGRGVVSVEARHEERTEAGAVAVARTMARQWALPSGSRAEEVTSNLSRDGVLVITVPRTQHLATQDRAVPIKMDQ